MFVFSLFAAATIMYGFLVAGIFTLITISEEGIRVGAKKLMKPKELRWDEIRWVVDDSWLGLHIYHLIPKSHGKQRITIPWSVKDYEELLAEIIERAPQAQVEESIKRMVAKSK